MKGHIALTVREESSFRHFNGVVIRKCSSVWKTVKDGCKQTATLHRAENWFPLHSYRTEPHGIFSRHYVTQPKMIFPRTQSTVRNNRMTLHKEAKHKDSSKQQ